MAFVLTNATINPLRIMIGKIPKAGRGFKGIVSYLLGGRKAEHPEGKGPGEGRNRVLWTETGNLVTSDPRKALQVMRATANQSRRCKAPVYHFVISWTREEQPDTDTMRRIVATTCNDMGLSDLQRIAIAHDDTRHPHVHVVVNRIDPESGKAWNRRQDWVRLEQSLARQAKTLGLQYVPGRHSEPDAFKNKPRKAPDREYQAARRQKLGAPPMKWGPNRLAAERMKLALIFDAARDWKELDASLAAVGLRLEQKGQGHVLRDMDSEIKLSQISDTTRVKLFEKRFGQTLGEHRKASPPVQTYLPPDLKTDRIPRHNDLKTVTSDTHSHHPQDYPDHNNPMTSSEVDRKPPVRNHPSNDNTTQTPAPDDTPTPSKRKRRRSRGRS